LTNVDRIPDGSLLFTCRIDIAADAEAGEYQLAALRLLGSTGQGEPVAAMSSGGSVVVADPVEGSVSLESGAGAGAAGGCAIQPTDVSALAWMLVLFPVVLWRYRRAAVALQ
jgi:hypothetical protein